MTDEKLTVRVCTQCHKLVDFKEWQEPISLCARCADTLANRVCRVEGCTRKRTPGFMFCANCLAQGATLLPLEESLFAGFVATQRIRIPDDIRPDPLAAAERMCPEVTEEYAREFADRLTLQHVDLNRWPRINWGWVHHQARVFGNAVAMGALMMLAAIAAWGLAVLVLGFAPGNGGVTFGGGR